MKYGVYHRGFNSVVLMGNGYAIFDTEKEARAYHRWLDNNCGTDTIVKEVENKPED